MKSGCCSSPLCGHKNVVVPRGVTRRPHPLRSLILAGLVLVLACSPFVSAAILDGQVLGRMSGTGQAIEPAIEYVRDDVVVSEVHLSGTREGDRIRWEFAGPEDTVWNESKTLIAGQETARAILDLGLLQSNEAVGLWTLDIFVNDEPASRADFTVEPLTGLVWWGPFAGALMLLVVVVVVAGVIMIAGLALKKRFCKGKT